MPEPHVQQLYNALQVMLLDHRIRGWLQQNDPKALEQAEAAVTVAEEADPALADVLRRPSIETKLDAYTVEPGRNIYRNGEPLISIHLASQRGDPAWNPSEADTLTRTICSLLNVTQPKNGRID